jgi:hypothetical protein
VQAAAAQTQGECSLHNLLFLGSCNQVNSFYIRRGLPVDVQLYIQLLYTGAVWECLHQVACVRPQNSSCWACSTTLGVLLYVLQIQPRPVAVQCGTAGRQLLHVAERLHAMLLQHGCCCKL